MSRRPKPRLLITRLLTEGQMTHEEIAQVTNCSAKTVQRVQQELQQETEGYEEKMAEYRRRIHRRLPISRRVELYAGLAEQDQHPIAKLKTLERLDELEGIQTEKKQWEEEPEHRPMFVLPAGSQVMIGIKTPGGIEDTEETSAVEVNEKLKFCGGG
jgi:transposase